MIAHGAAIAVEIFDCLFETMKGRVVVELTLHKPDALRKLLPHILVKWGARVLLHRVVHDLGKVFVYPVTSGEANESEAGWK